MYATSVPVSVLCFCLKGKFVFPVLSLRFRRCPSTQPRIIPTTLSAVAAAGRVDAVAELLPAASADELSAAVVLAARWGHAHVLEKLLWRAGCTDTRRALQLAALHGHADAVSLLLPHEDSCEPSPQGGRLCQWGLVPLFFSTFQGASRGSAVVGH